MKPEHFIYKSDGLYYIHNMPNNCYYYYRDERTQTEEFDHKSYNEALECAKAEAVKIVEGNLLIAEYIIKQVYDIHEVKDYRKGMKSYLEEGCVYTINMEEKIEVYDMELTSCEHCISCQLIPNCTTLAARIAAPKKEEETQEQIWREAIEDIVDPRTAFEKGKNIDYLMTKFEIKRKPL